VTHARSILWLAGVCFAGAAARLPVQQRDPLAPLVAEALRNNLGLEQQRLAERRTANMKPSARAPDSVTSGQSTT
jgi:hypothetical protein